MGARSGAAVRVMAGVLPSRDARPESIVAAILHKLTGAEMGCVRAVLAAKGCDRCLHYAIFLLAKDICDKFNHIIFRRDAEIGSSEIVNPWTPSSLHCHPLTSHLP